MRLIIACLFVFTGQIHAATCAEFWDNPELVIDDNLACALWPTPTQNTDGSPLTDLAGFWIYYGQDSAALLQTDAEARRTDSSVSWIEIDNAQTNDYEIILEVTEPTTFFFGITAFDTSGNEAVISELVSKVIRFVDNVAPRQIQTFRVQMRIRVPVPGGELQHP